MTSASEPVNVEVRGPNPWLVLMILGIVTSALGIWLMLSRDASKSFVVLLLGIGLFLNAISELVWASDKTKPWIGYALGALYAVGGIVVLTQQDAGQWVIALVIGITLIVLGLLQIAVSLMERDEARHWGWAAAFGVLTLVIGVAAIAWPGVTLRVVGFLMGIRLLLLGLGFLGLGNDFRKLRPA